LDFIVNWANNPESERTLVLFGQAGTGKSCIAHEVACRFDKMQRLSSSFVFRRGDGPKPQDLFPTLVRDLSDRYPSFKAALREVIKNNTSLRHTQDYRRVFQSLLRDPLIGLHIVGPIVIIIDALDESRDVAGSRGLHSFLAEHIVELPSNFRILITSRPESAIVDVFNRASAVRIIYTSDTELSARTDNDIRTYLENNLPLDIFKKHGSQLVQKAEGLFQWVAVACSFILKPPAGLTKQKCIHGLLAPSSNHEELNLLDHLYAQVLEAYFTTRGARYQFQSIIGPLLAVVKPLSISSLTSLRRFAPVDDPDDEESVSSIVSHLGSLLSNVTSSELPIVPLHTSFRDFLTNKDQSGDFYIDLYDAHYQLATSCLGLMLDDDCGLRFNICHLESSYLANSDIPGLQSLIEMYISPAMSYACHFWGNHLEHILCNDRLIKELQLFFEKKFLFWLEVLSLVDSMSFASLMLSSVKAWLASTYHKVCMFNVSK
jgi:NACHT domain